MAIPDLGFLPHQANFSRPGEQGTSLQQLFARFPDDAAILRYVFTSRFGECPSCPRCRAPCEWTPGPNRRQFIHKACKTHISPLSGTLMDRSRIPPSIWFYTMLHLANSRESVSGHFLSRHLGLSLPAAYRMLIRIRLHLAAVDHLPTCGEPGAAVNIRIEQISGMAVPGRRRNRAHVLLIEADGVVQTIVLDGSRPHRARGLLMRRLPKNVRLFTGCAQTMKIIRFYGQFKSPQIALQSSSLAAGENQADPMTAFLASFRRGMRLQHQTVSPKNFWLLLKECEFRFNRRFRSSETFFDMIGKFPIIDDRTALQLRQVYSDVAEP